MNEQEKIIAKLEEKRKNLYDEIELLEDEVDQKWYTYQKICNNLRDMGQEVSK